ncbi:MAG: alpha/beta fold hydrolase [Pseudomonadota bacterium]
MIRDWKNPKAGHLPVLDGRRIAWWCWGNPLAPTLLLLHGGPGGGISPGLRATFDPEAWQIVAMDQRGSGQSEPHAGRDLSALDANTTEDLIVDAERLRTRLGVENWALFGGSWGASLAQAYAHAHRSVIRGMVLVGVTQSRATEIDWLYGDLRHLLPEAFAAFQAGAPGAAPGRPLVAAYRDLLRSPETAQTAADRWCAWEAAAIAADPRHQPGSRWQDAVFRLGFARIVTHYFAQGAWLRVPLDTCAADLGDLPGELVHSRLDLSAPLTTAWELSRAWPGAHLTILQGGLHSAAEGAMQEATRDAAQRLRDRLR